MKRLLGITGALTLGGALFALAAVPAIGADNGTVKASIAAATGAAPLGPTAPARPGSPDAARLALPLPLGKSRVGTIVLRLVDATRRDAYAPDRRRRELMVRLWYPARTTAGHVRSAYMSKKVAGLYETRFGLPARPLAALRTHGYVAAPAASGRSPVLLLSAPNGNRSGNYTVLAQNLASEGYVVVAIDHPYDSIVVEFPGGRLVTGQLPEGEAALRKALSVRVADVRFVLDRLAGLNRSGPLAGRLDLNSVGMLGHSFGGATAAAAMLADSRIKAGVDLDGYLSGQVINRGLDRPFMLMLAPGTFGDSTVAQFFSRLRGPRVALEIAGSTHLSFGDFAILRAQFGKSLPAGFPSTGSIAPLRGMRVRHAYLAAFFGRHLRAQADSLTAAPSPQYPEVRLLP